MLGLEPGERQALLLEPGAARREIPRRERGARLQRARPCEIGADIGGAGMDDGERARQHRADMHDIVDRARLHDADQRGTPGERLQRRDEPRDRPLPRGEPRALRGEQPVDERDPRLAGADVRLGLLDARGDRCLLRTGLERLVLLVRGGALEPGRARGGRFGLRLGLDQALLLLGDGILGRRGRDNAERGDRRRASPPVSHPPPEHGRHPSR